MVPFIRKILIKKRENNFMVETWDDLLDELIDEPEFKSSIEENGFYKSDTSLKVFTKKYNFQPLQNTAVC